jgi:hypothetical protein
VASVARRGKARCRVCELPGVGGPEAVERAVARGQTFRDIANHFKTVTRRDVERHMAVCAKKEGPGGNAA